MNCRRVSQLLSAYTDRELGGTEMLAIREHLGNCRHCDAEYQQLRGMKKLMGAIPTREPRVGLEAAIIAQARQERELINLPSRSLGFGLAAVLAIPRPLAIAAAMATLLLGTLLWPVARNAARENPATNISTFEAEHTTYQSYQPLAGGASIDLASSDARLKLADFSK